MTEADAATFVACLTPAGTGAIATLAVHGPRAWDAARVLFQPRRGTVEDTPGRFWLGRLGGDEVVLTLKRLTPVPWVEVHCHGGREVVRLLLEAFAAQGVAACDWRHFERLLAADPARAAAAVALAEAPTRRTAAILLDQYQGACGRALGAVLEALHRGDPGGALQRLQEMNRHAALGRHLTQSWRVVVAGAPNVGKSSLVNALAGYQRSVVAPTPGTTRDVVTTRLALDGWPVEVADTAGLRPNADTLEEAGIDRARAAAAAADLCLWILDAAAPPVWPDAAPGTMRYVVNKVDLPAAWDLEQAGGAVRVSALTGAGLAELCQALSHWLVPEPPPPGAAVPFTPRLCERLEAAQRLCAAGRSEEAERLLAALWGEPG